MARRKAKLPAWAHGPAYVLVRSLGAAFQAADPAVLMHGARRLGRAYASARWNRHRLARAEANLRIAFPRLGDEPVRELAIKSYEHLFHIGVEIALAPRFFSEEGWLLHVRLGEVATGVGALLSGRPCLLITGHCGNWELTGYTASLLGFPVHAVYRANDLTALDRWLRTVRGRRGLVLVDKFGVTRELPRLMESGAVVGFVADQNGGDRGVFVPFFNRLTSTYKSIGLLALQYGASIVCGYARRLGEPGEPSPQSARSGYGWHYQLDIVDTFGPDDWRTHPDPLFYLTARYRRALETMIRRAPTQYDWMHRVWRSRPRHERLNRPFPRLLLDRIRQLPWITDEDVDRLVEQSRRDALTLAETGAQRLS